MMHTRPLVFIVEDDEEVASLLCRIIQSAGFDVQSFVNGTSVVSEGLRLRPALFLLDVVLPGASDGFELCRQIRRNSVLSSTPIIFVTALTSEADRVKGLELGGDDYITKPFSPRELVARIRSTLRRPTQGLIPADTVRLGELELDPSSMTLTVRGRSIPATVQEFKLLSYLAHNRGRIFTRDQLLQAVWNESRFVSPRSIDVYIRRLRAKIEPDIGHPQYLKTLRGVGYRLEVPRVPGGIEG